MRPHFSSRRLDEITFAIFSILAILLAAVGDASAQGFKFLEVKVVDPDGKPMADVAVEINLNGMSFPMPTDADGKVAVNVPTGERTELEIRVRHEDYVAMGVAWRGDEKIPESVTIPLVKGVSFGGIVHDQQDQPVDGAQVSGAMVFENRHGFVHDGKVMPYLDGELAKTDKEGRWQCSLAPEGNVEFQLRFSHPKFVDQGGYHSRGGNWDELKGMKNVVVLEQGFTVSGTILDPEGHPASRARVDITSIIDGSHRGSQNFADGEGKFETLPVPVGKATLSVIAPGLAPLRMEVDSSKQDELLALHLEKGQPIQIKVVNRAGEPLAKAYVWITDWHYTGSRLDLDDHDFADEQGVWRWQHAPNEELTYQIWAPGYRESKHQLKASEEVQTVTLEPAVKITGNVLDKQTREPIKKFRLTQIASIDCGEGCNAVIAYGDNEFNTAGEYNFQTGLLCKESHLACSAKGYKNSSSRKIVPDEAKVQWDFELERDDNSQTR